MSSLSKQFTSSGGVFVTPSAVLTRKLKSIRALVLDWDGVFNPGHKGDGHSSGYTEPDAMGVNLLRYGLWRKNGRLPISAILSGQPNPSAVQFAERERLHAIYTGLLDKREGLRHLCEMHQLKPAEIATVFDDVNDLGLAQDCGVRCLIHRGASPLLKQYAAKRKLCDYITGHDPRHHAIREVAELLLGHLGAFDAVAESRAAFDASYQKYYAERQACRTRRFRLDNGKINSEGPAHTM